MMNIILAFACLASCLTGLVVVPPAAHQQPSSSHGASHLLDSAKQAVKHAAQHVLCDQPPCPPTALEKTANSLEDAKEFVRDRAEVAKESAEDVYHDVKVGMQDTAEKARHGMHGLTLEKTKHGMHDSVEKAKHGVHETVEKGKHGVHETVEKAKHGMHDAVEKAKHGTADMAASLIPGKGKEVGEHPHPESDPDLSYIMPGVSKTMESLKRTFDEETHELVTILKGSPAMESLKRKAEQAAGYMLSGRQAEEDIGGVHQGVKETIGKVQDKVSNLLEGASNMAHDVQDKARDMVSEAGKMSPGKGDYKDKLGGVLQGIKEKITRSTHTKEDGDGLEMKVHELCSMFGADQTKAKGGLHMVDANALRESYGYLMDSAIKAIDGAKEIFEKVTEREGSEWKVKYMYLGDSAKGALGGARDVFARAISAMEDEILQMQKESNDHVIGSLKERIAKKNLTSRLREAALHTKQRLAVSMHSLLCTLYLASFSLAYGVTLWTTFVSGYLLSHALPRQQLALVQSKLFPTYLRVITGCLIVCGIGHMALHPWPSANWWEHLQNWNFSLLLMVSLCNTILVEPMVTKAMFEKLRIEREEGRGQSADSRDEATLARSTAFEAKFKGLHQLASFTNLFIIGGLAWHLWYLAHRLVV